MKILILISLVGVLFSGCGKNDSPSSPDYSGTWAGACTSIGTRTTAIISGNSAVSQIESFDGSTCSSTLGFTIKATTSFTLGAPVTGIDGAYSADFVNQKATITIQSDADLTFFNSGSICGITNWTKQETDVSGKDCGTYLGTFTAGSIGYDIMKSNSVNGQSYLYFGDKSAAATNGKSATTRPTALDTADALTKQ